MTMITSLQNQLDQRADAKTKAWWERYLKHVIPFRGVKMADIRAVLHQWVREERFAQTGAGWVLRELSLADQARVVAFVEECIGQFIREGLAYATEKMAAETQARLNTLHKASRQQAG